MHFEEFGIVLLIAAAACPAAHAGSIEAYSGAVAGLNQCSGGGAPAGMNAFFGNLGFGIGNAGNGISDCGLSGGINDVVQAVGPAVSNSNLHYTGGFGGTGSTYTGGGSATANYGSASVSVTGDLSGPDRANGVAESVAFGLVEDTWNVGGGSGSGFVQAIYTLNAEASLTGDVSGSLEGEVNVQIGSGGPARIFFGQVVTGSAAALGLLAGPVPGCTTTATSYQCTNATIMTGMVPITFGTAMQYNMGMLIAADPGAGVSVDPALGLTGIQVFDANGNRVQNFTITSGSGAVYGANGIDSVPVSGTPEPSTFLLAGLALITASAVRRRRCGPGR